MYVYSVCTCTVCYEYLYIKVCVLGSVMDHYYIYY